MKDNISTRREFIQKAGVVAVATAAAIESARAAEEAQDVSGKPAEPAAASGQLQ